MKFESLFGGSPRASKSEASNTLREGPMIPEGAHEEVYDGLRESGFTVRRLTMDRGYTTIRIESSATSDAKDIGSFHPAHFRYHSNENSERGDPFYEEIINTLESLVEKGTPVDRIWSEVYELEEKRSGLSGE